MHLKVVGQLADSPRFDSLQGRDAIAQFCSEMRGVPRLFGRFQRNAQARSGPNHSPRAEQFAR